MGGQERVRACTRGRGARSSAAVRNQPVCSVRCYAVCRRQCKPVARLVSQRVIKATCRKRMNPAGTSNVKVNVHR